MSDVTRATGTAPGGPSRTEQGIDPADRREARDAPRSGLPPGGDSATGAAPGAESPAPGATPAGVGDPSFGDRSAFTSREWGAWHSPPWMGAYASPTLGYNPHARFQGAPMGGVPAVGGSAPVAPGSISVTDLRQVVHDAISPITARLAKVEGSMRASRHKARRRREGSSTDPSTSSSGSPSTESSGTRREARRIKASAHRRVARVLSPGSEEEPPRVVPDKVIPDDDTYAGILDCESYALANKSVRYDEKMAHGLGRKRKEIATTFGRDAEWNGTPPLGVFEFLNRFRKACDDNNLSEGRALYLLPEFTQGDLKKELLSIMPSTTGGRTGEVTSYLELVNWLLRSYADEEVISTQVAEFNAASQEEDEDETAFYRRVRKLNALCGYIHSSSQVKGRFLQGIWWEVRTDVREHNNPSMPLEGLVRYAQRKGDICRRRNEELRAERAAEDVERRARRLARRIAAGVTTSTPSPSTPSPYGGKGKARAGQTMPALSEKRPLRFPCMACNSLEHYTRNCPELSAGTRAKFAAAYAQRERAKGRSPQVGGPAKSAVAAVGGVSKPPTEEEPEPVRPSADPTDTPTEEEPSSGNE